MTIFEYAPSREDILVYLDEQIRQLREDGVEARFIVVGRDAYEMLCKAIGERFQRGAGRFESYQFVPIVLDPFRTASVCVLPAPAECARGVQTYRIPQNE